ncbi:hypothetical protein P691DRAFT_470890 [Macrolepiota fuliginosa MF-IS2]|uniref:DUF6697 domain-containing protein n=1 Tax=Macrolepiota fuliginosa MF-IS2 TaxID=1400762 RepID=A0A9P5X221_9AGAR|nr:hypothetical protein P691DRAFT_551715 [Macrolepiota fuliginosa MF-IS2]KAF9442560.1 hypothetical protein P691DRAFT_470890 [Macrolepiota fuliginosa MF-IS2]
MATTPGLASDEKRYTFIIPSDSQSNEARPELPMNPLRIAEMAIEIQLEKVRVAEAMGARDALVQKLSDAYTSIREKTELIERLQQTLNAAMNPSSNATHTAFSPALASQQTWEQTPEVTGLRSQVADLEALIQELRIGSRNAMGPPPRYEEQEERKAVPAENHSTMAISDAQTTLAPISPFASDVQAPSPVREERSVQTFVPEEPEDMVNTRFAILASIPLPDNPPDDTLKPIVLPPACTLHEFLSSTSGVSLDRYHSKNMFQPLFSLSATRKHPRFQCCSQSVSKPSIYRLGSYRVLQSLTTKWCPTREEHGYFYSPLFKCSTNPRVTTAHRWQPVDVTARMKQSTECFYNREGLWYYAGSYQAFRLEDLAVKEWAELPTEAANYLVKETISGRKNVSPQNIYEVNQLYNAGALKVACVGLQCVGFNQDVYRSVLDHASKFTQTKWKNMSPSIPGTNTNVATPLITGVNSGISVNTNKTTISIKSPTGTSRPVSPTLLGPANVGFGAVAAGLGLGNGATWNTTATLLAQGNNQMVLQPNGDESLQSADNAILGYRAGAKK